jgi:L-lactate dehydrogenase complex protein LldE
MPDAQQAPYVGLFVTCLVDLFRPSVGFAAIKLLEAGGARVEVPGTQTCCGQPAYNSGDRQDAIAIELTSFLVDVLGLTAVDTAFPETVTYHDSCSSLRELHAHDAPRRLLSSVEGLSLVELADSEVCCGFGGAFSVKYPEISAAIDDAKLRDIAGTGATTVLSGDLGCLLQIAGRLARERKIVAVRHVAEVLAGMTDEPAIAGSGQGR